LGSSCIYRKDFHFFFDSLFFFQKKFNIIFHTDLTFSFNVVSDYLGFITASECGLVPGVNSSIFYKTNSNYFKPNSLVYLLSTDVLDFNLEKTIIIYQGFFNIFSFNQVFLYYQFLLM